MMLFKLQPAVNSSGTAEERKRHSSVMGPYPFQVSCEPAHFGVSQEKGHHTATIFLHMAQSVRSSLKGSILDQYLHAPSIIMHSYNGPANRILVKSKVLHASTNPGGQYPIRCHGEGSSKFRRRRKVHEEHRAVE